MVSLRHAYEQGSLRLSFQCMRPIDRSPGICGKTGRIGIDAALKRWGDDIQIKDIPARCSRCGSSDFVSVMGEPPGREGKRGSNR